MEKKLSISQTEKSFLFGLLSDEKMTNSQNREFAIKDECNESINDCDTREILINRLLEKLTK